MALTLIRVKLWWYGSQEQFIIWLAWLLPKVMVKWAVIRCFAHATRIYPSKTPDQIDVFAAIAAWEDNDAD